MKFTKMNFKNFKSGPRNVMMMVALFTISLLVMTKLTDYSRSTQAMSYSAFLKNVETDQVKAVHISGQDVTGALKDGKRFETVIADNNQNWDLLRKHNVEFSVGSASGQFSVWHLVFLAFFVLSLGAIWFFVRQNRGSGGGSTLFSMGKSKAKMFMPSQIKINFDAVAGAQEAKDELKDIVDFLKNPEKYKKLGATLTRGVLLVGEPGNGKTLLAKAVAGEANCPFFSISGSDFIEVFVGVGAARMRDLFAQARKNAPSIIFIDEIDAIGRQRGGGIGGGGLEEREQTLNQLLTEMDGFDSSSAAPVVVLAATNIPDVLDKALLRPGRFDRRISVPFPDIHAREQILKINAQASKLSPDVDLYAIAVKTAGFSGSDLANLVNQAALNASKKNQELITQADFDYSYAKLLQSQDAQAVTSSMDARTSSKAKMYMPTQVKVNFNSVAGVHEAKEELYDVVDFLKNPKKYHDIGARLTRGVLLVGEPGNGKTLLAKAVAGEANCPFFSASGSEFVEVFVGVGAARVRDLFAQARRHSPSIIFIDEIDAIGRQRGGSSYSNDERDQALNQLLTEMDGFESRNSSVIVIAATNRADILDKALLRPGRFDRRVDVPYPDLVSREEILQVHARGVKIDESVDLKKIARGTPGFSGAALENLINEAATHAAKFNKPLVTLEDFDEARDKIILGKESKSIIMSPKELEMTAYHEAGHAMVTLVMPEVLDPLYKVTIIPRGPALGVTHSLPERDKYSVNKEELFAKIMMCLGGRAAEELIFNNISGGARSDFMNATNIAHNMVTQYGMSDDLGMVVYQNGQYSQESAAKIDHAVKSIIDDCYKKTQQLLVDNKDKLEILSKKLLEKETLFAHEIYELLGITPRTDHRLL
ncbi:MAG: ATP-dependent zinc metalloprotease FtsH [Candidatus Babeliaceae bacterium]|jgi:cell division protease FtsH